MESGCCSIHNFAKECQLELILAALFSLARRTCLQSLRQNGGILKKLSNLEL